MKEKNQNQSQKSHLKYKVQEFLLKTKLFNINLKIEVHIMVPKNLVISYPWQS